MHILGSLSSCIVTDDEIHPIVTTPIWKPNPNSYTTFWLRVWYLNGDIQVLMYEGYCAPELYIPDPSNGIGIITGCPGDLSGRRPIATGVSKFEIISYN